MAKIYTYPTTSGGIVTLRPNYAGIGDMLSDRALLPALAGVAEKMRGLAEAAAPVARTGTHRGRYKASFQVVTGYRAAPHRRVFARLQNDAPEALAVEYGTARTRRNGPPHRTLRNAAHQVRGL